MPEIGRNVPKVQPPVLAHVHLSPEDPNESGLGHSEPFFQAQTRGLKVLHAWLKQDILSLSAKGPKAMVKDDALVRAVHTIYRILLNLLYKYVDCMY